jgi:predicted phage terminase large subunit-like protein
MTMSSPTDRRKAAYSPAGLARYASPYPYVIAPHLRFLNRKLLETVYGHTKRLVISMPPRSGKSELISHYLPAWYVASFPNRQVILAGYETTFAAEWGGKAREVIVEHGPEVFGVTVDEHNSARNNWRVKHKMAAYSVMRTAGLGGPLTGKGADMLVLDDPVKNADSVLSQNARDRMWDWWVSVAYTRLQKGGTAIVVGTRWHEDDLIGRLIRQRDEGEEDWEVLNLPAIAEPGDPIGRTEGEALWPEMFPPEVLGQIRRTQGPYWWAAMYMGRPTPLEGGVLKREWMNNRYSAPPAMQRVIQTVDSAAKSGEDNDYSIVATWGTDGIDFYLLDVWRAKVEFPELKRAVSDQFIKHQPSAVYVEDASSGMSLLQEMQRETMIPVIAQQTISNKLGRVHAVSGLFQSGKVKLPRTAPWLAEWIEEHTSFPNGAYDDQVDTTAYALHELAYQGSPVMVFV